jgi:DNA-binding MarR family transcriptional regulator
MFQSAQSKSCSALNHTSRSWREEASVGTANSLTPSAPPPVTPQRIDQLLKARRARAAFFDDALFADPAWDILLELYAAKLAHRRLSVSAVCRRAAVPATTALRWIKTLEGVGHILRSNDLLDKRRVFLELSPNAHAQMSALFRSLREVII